MATIFTFDRCEYGASDRIFTYLQKSGLTCNGAPYDFGVYSLPGSRLPRGWLV